MIGQIIKTLRLSRNLTIRQLAKEIGIKGSGTISQWETEERDPGPEHRKKLCQFFGIEEWQLFTLHHAQPIKSPPSKLNQVLKDSETKKTLEKIKSVLEAILEEPKTTKEE